MTGPTWDSVGSDLVGELSRLEDREFVVLGEPLARIGPTGLSGECVGATSFGGDWEISPEQDARIRALGWYAPGEMPDTEPGYPNYRHDVPRDQAERLAGMGVQALAVLGVQPDGSLELRRDR